MKPDKGFKFIVIEYRGKSAVMLHDLKKNRMTGHVNIIAAYRAMKRRRKK